MNLGRGWDIPSPDRWTAGGSQYRQLQSPARALDPRTPSAWSWRSGPSVQHLPSALPQPGSRHSVSTACCCEFGYSGVQRLPETTRGIAFRSGLSRLAPHPQVHPCVESRLALCDPATVATRLLWHGILQARVLAAVSSSEIVRATELIFLLCSVSLLILEFFIPLSFLLLGFSCGVWACLFWSTDSRPAGSAVTAPGLAALRHMGSQFPDPGSNPVPALEEKQFSSHGHEKSLD